MKSAHRVPSHLSLLSAAAYDRTSTAVSMGKLAAWTDLLGVLERAGWDAAKRMQLLLEVAAPPTLGGNAPPLSVFVRATEALSDATLDALIATQLETPLGGDTRYAVIIALPLLEEWDVFGLALYDSRLLSLPSVAIRRLLEAFDPAARDEMLASWLDTKEPSAACVFLETASFSQTSVMGPRPRPSS